jgi:hypothetical protein
MEETQNSDRTMNNTQRIAQYLASRVGNTVALKTAMKACAIEQKPALRIMRKLAREGCLEQFYERTERTLQNTDHNLRRFPTWKIIDRARLRQAAVRKEGGKPGPTVRDHIWKAVRLLRRFTIADLERIAKCTKASAVDFTRVLEAGEWVRFEGRDGKKNVYQLLHINPPVDRPKIEEPKKEKPCQAK